MPSDPLKLARLCSHVCIPQNHNFVRRILSSFLVLSQEIVLHCFCSTLKGILPLMFQRSQGDVNASVPKLVPKLPHPTAMAPGLYNRHRRPSEFDHHTACNAGYSTPVSDLEICCTIDCKSKVAKYLVAIVVCLIFLAN